MRRLRRIMLMTAVAVSLLTTGGARAETAESILKATGVTGGLIVHIGCGDGKLTADLGKAGAFLVCGLDKSSENVAAARKRVQGLGLYGKVAIDRLQGAELPYVDNLVNLLVVDAGAAPDRKEMLRVLAPEGAAYIRSGDRWEKTIKPRPAEIDQWTHYMYDASGNPVSKDKLVSPPEHLQWTGGPRWCRHHDHMNSMSALVSAGGRIFYIFDEGSTKSIMLPSKWKLIARDAFSGVVLWKKPIHRWWTRFTPLKSGPAQLPRRLVAVGDKVYTTLGLHAPVSQIDAVSGKTLKTYKGTENTWEIILHDGLLCAVSGSKRAEEEETLKRMFEKARTPGNPTNKPWTGWDRKLLAFNADGDGEKPAWKISSIILPGTLTAEAGTIFLHNGVGVTAVDAKTGKEKWKSAPVEIIDIKKGIPHGFMPSMIVRSGVIVVAGGKDYGQHMRGKTDKMIALSAKDGKILWDAPHYTSGYQSPEDLLAAGNTVLSPFATWLKGKDAKNNNVLGADLKTGRILYDSKPDVTDPVWFIHHRCHPSKATEDYLLMSKEGIEFVDLKTRKWRINHWIRGACIYGIMPANGLTYAPMHPCACSADMKLNGFNAVAGARARKGSKIDVTKHILEKGPAFAKVSNPKSRTLPTGRRVPNPKSADWPTFRHDPGRSGVASCAVGGDLKTVWETEIGGKLTAPVVAGGRLYVAAVDRHTLHVLDAGTGGKLWSFTTGGRIDSPPTIFRGMAIFGSRDGCAYCLRASDGALVWRFRAVATDRRVMALEQIESAWPVHGSVLVRNGEVLFVAGRSEFLDGGLQMFRLKPETGEVISRATFNGKAPDGGVLTGAEEKRLAGLSDVLSTDGEFVFMRAGVIRIEGDRMTKDLLPAGKVIRYPGGGKRPAKTRIKGFAKAHLFSSYGFLDDSWFHRSYWVYSPVCSHRHNYGMTGTRSPAGRILVVDDKNVYGFGRQQKYFNWTTPMEYRLFARAKTGHHNKAMIWDKPSPDMLVEALVLAGDALYAAGTPDVLDETKPGIRDESPETLAAMKKQDAALAGESGGLFASFSRADGVMTKKIDLPAPPVFDGLIAANGRIYIVLRNGAVQCRGKR